MRIGTGGKAPEHRDDYPTDHDHTGSANGWRETVPLACDPLTQGPGLVAVSWHRVGRLRRCCLAGRGVFRKLSEF